jgi:hypothetical protein
MFLKTDYAKSTIAAAVAPQYKSCALIVPQLVEVTREVPINREVAREVIIFKHLVIYIFA